MSQGDKGHAILLVKKDEAKKGALWIDLAEQRSMKQHGGGIIPDNDIHALPKHQDPARAQAPKEEAEAKFAELETQIKNLKAKEHQALPPSQHRAPVNDNPDDWLKE